MTTAESVESYHNDTSNNRKNKGMNLWDLIVFSNKFKGIPMDKDFDTVICIRYPDSSCVTFNYEGKVKAYNSINDIQ